MTNDDRNSRGDGSRPGLVAWLKKLYADRPTVFAAGVIGVSALVFLLGGVVSGDVAVGL